MDNSRILYIETDPEILARLEEKFSSLGYPESCNASGNTPIHMLRTLGPDLALLGPSLDDQTLKICLYRLKIMDPSMPVFMCREGAPQPLELDRFPFKGIFIFRMDDDAGRISATMRDAFKFRTESDLLPGYPVLIGENREICNIREQVGRVAAKEITVLITGESGTGKEIIARAIHWHSGRKGKPFVKINCGALPDELLESEVFGFQRGAFTGAHKDKPGRVEVAEGGTLFIDEIGDLNLPLQAKFLQVLEDRTFTRLGGIRDETVDVRVVAATNSDLSKKMREGQFRKDLFHRLYVIHIEAPPLRERKEDIPLLIHYFMNKYCFELNREAFEIPARVMDIFHLYQWPGNVRELENAVKRGIALRDWDLVAMDLDLNGIAPQKNPVPAPGGQPALPAWDDEKLKGLFREHDFSLKEITRKYVTEAEQEAISKALKESQWNRKKAARILGVSYKTMLNRITEMDLET